MPHPHHTTYADNIWQGTVTVIENVRLARDTYRLRFGCPEIARRIVPGQFLMVRLAGYNDPLLGRPLALYDVVAGESRRCDFQSPESCRGDFQSPSSGRSETASYDVSPYAIDIVYLVVGKMTGLLATLPPGAPLEVWGPLGNGFPPDPAEHLMMVAGGIGQTPFLALGREYLGLQTFGDPPRQVPKARKVTLCYGARRQEYLAGVADFERIGVEVRLSTDDGSAGHRGLATELIRPVVEQSPWLCRIVACGPEPMLAATARVAKELNLPCQVSLESPMACGIGACFSCVTKIRDADGGWDYRRTCVEGPVFAAEDVVF
jgi:dihydroorotate dehydrogenase electron transfer subunit